MPFPNFHSARLRDPDDFEPDSFRNTTGGKLYGRITVPDDVQVIWGKLKEASESDDMPLAQALRFPSKSWSVERAKEWLADNSVKYISFEPAEEKEKGQSRLPADGMLYLTSPVTVLAAPDDNGPGRFEMVAYTGGAMNVGWLWPVVVDLAGINIGSKSRPVLLEHNTRDVVGHTETIDIGDTIAARGVFSGAGPAAAEVQQAGRRGFPWQASLGLRVDRAGTDEIGEGETAVINGRTWTGPLYAVRSSVMKEISFVALGADDDTSVRFIASASEREFVRMDEEKGQVKEEAVAADSKPDVTAEDLRLSATAEAKRAAEAEEARIAAVKQVSGTHADIAAMAIEAGWTPERAELEVLRAERPRISGIRMSGPAATPRVLECAIRLGSSEPEGRVAKDYDEQTLEAAHRHRRMGIRGLIELTCAMEGRPRPPLSASIPEWIQCAFSTESLPGILGATANKIMLAAFQAVPSAARLVAQKLTANDFKAHTGYRLGGDALADEIPPAGEIPIGTLTESTFTYAVKMYGKYLGLTYEMMVNDDLNAFSQLPQRIGRGCALTVEKLFWDLVIANTGSFFSGGNKNYISGIDTALGLVGLSLAKQALFELVDPDGNPIVISGKYLVVPPALEEIARNLYAADFTIAAGDADILRPSANIYKGMFEPIPVWHLKDYPKAWYLFGDPADVAAFGLAYLNGQETPTIEQVPLPPNYLGVAWRGYLAVGACQIEKQGAIMSAGE